MQEALKSRYAAVIPSLTCCCAALRLQGGLRNAVLWFMVLTAALPGTYGQNRRERDSDREDWFLIEFDGTPAGYEVVSERSVAAKGEEWVRVHQRRTMLRIRRQEQDLSLTTDLHIRTTAENRVHSWTLSRTSADGGVIRSTGTWSESDRGFLVSAGNGLSVELLQTLQPTPPRSPVFSTWLRADQRANPVAQEFVIFPESQAVLPMQIRRRRIPDRLSAQAARGFLAEIRIWPADYRDLETVVLQTPDSQTLQLELKVLGQPLTFTRTDALTALGLESAQGLDILLSSVIPVAGAFPNPHSKTTVRLRLRAIEPAPLSLPNSFGQSVQRDEDGSLIVELGLPRESSDVEMRLRTAERADQSEYLATGRWIDWDSAQVLRAAAISIPSRAGSEETARIFAALVHRKMQQSPFSTQLLPASEICQRWSGDCTEHAIALCALLRSQKVPARPVTGFLFVPQLNALVPHMWTEYFHEGTWQPLDSSHPEGVPAMFYLKVADAALAGETESGLSMFAALLNFAGKVSAEVLAR